MWGVIHHCGQLDNIPNKDILLEIKLLKTAKSYLERKNDPFFRNLPYDVYFHSVGLQEPVELAMTLQDAFVQVRDLNSPLLLNYNYLPLDGCTELQSALRVMFKGLYPGTPYVSGPFAIPLF